RVELALTRYGGQIAGIALERVVAFLGRGAVGLAALAQILDRRIELLRRHPAGGERIAGSGLLGQRQRQQQPLDRDETVAGLLGNLFGLLEDPSNLGGKIDLARTAALDP